MARRLALTALAVLLGGAGAWFFLVMAQAEPPPPYRLARVEEGPLVSAISATGTLNALVTVEVGSQLSGQIAELRADFNSPVTKGQILARLNGDQLDARLGQGRADLDSAEATLTMQRALLDKARADVATARATAADAVAQVARAQLAVVEADRDLTRREALRGRGVVATADLEKADTAARSARAQLESARALRQKADAGITAAEASLQVAEAQVSVAASQVEQKQAALQLVQVDVNRSTIRAPIDGVVVDRAVSIGQTVAASLQSPKLFTIVQDLRQMEVLANIDEADIGRVRDGLPVSFTVNAYPDDSFTGRVAQVRLAPKEEQNVVSYIVVISVENPEMRLLPGMTANLRIVVDERPSALKIPNAALRFRPPAPGGTGPDRRTSDKRNPDAGRTVWIAGAQGAAVPVPVRLGIGDGSFTEVVGGLSAGQEVIVGVAADRADQRQGTRLGF
ncbi:efflux RND transporter periplasmic adaptor subunit [Azospirillum sp. RWY-5-1]|uniref:Efflux RND transporter periplasmic adaptor subunit n=1 Tax=Azospirillum oleiclasticum TaxID=2735135 RepID=A0ABX2T4R4_9PROT|nr:efflux RND transporter periplasmic adaptor subunit [Azospirillum oleiclasticum]NYZ12160.1 efflux RND transporter periplasmic adaptor subunit [Azospirillum oleiclasticum]NYZ19320.1 efflux RND transporter periplasmic adaptor subunit [Azospirillum oleiclasticum]